MILDEIVSKRKEHYKKIMEEFPLSTLISKINSLEIEDNIKFYDLVSKKEFIYICECKKSNLKIKIFIKYDKTFNRFYGFAKTCWHSFHPHKISKFHPNEQIRSLENESINN